MAREIKVGIIGCGQVSRVGHGPAIASDERARIAAIADPDDENRAKLERIFRIPAAYSDHREMLRKEELDAVVQAGANQVYGVTLTVADETVWQSEARAKAMADARSRAQELADLAGVAQPLWELLDEQTRREVGEFLDGEGNYRSVNLLRRLSVA